MATAAPTAAAPAAQAAATPAGPAPASQPAAAPAGEPNAPRSIKPIPPPPRLPGVMDDGPEPATSRPADSRARDAAGRFVAGEPKGDETVPKPKPSATEAADVPPPPIEPPAKPEPFEFAGEKYDSRELAEQKFKSLRGMFKPLADIAQSVGGMDKIAPKYLEAAASARGWKSEADRLAARVAELEAGAASPAPQSQPDAPAQGIDWELYAEISRVANEAGTPEKAQRWLIEQVEAQRARDIAALREEAIESPRRAAEEQAALVQTADTLVESMAAQTNPDGTPAFPEYRDGEQAHEVGALWSSMGLDPRIALTPEGAVAAVALYRYAKSLRPATPAPAVPTSAPQPAPRDLAAEAAAALEGGRPLIPSAGATRELEPGVARLVAGLKNTQLTRPGLGFEL